MYKKVNESALQVERQGVLRKWSKHIHRWQPRFLRTNRSMLAYWKYKGAPPREHAEPDLVLDLRDVALITKQPEELVFHLCKAGGEKVLTLKASCQPELKGWVTTLEDKVRYLQEHDKEEEDTQLTLSCRTNTFTVLLLMDTREIDAYANESLNEIFSQSDGSILASVTAAYKLIKVLTQLCTDYEVELKAVKGQKSERQARDVLERVFHQYYSALQNRLILEVMAAIGPELTVALLTTQPIRTSVAILDFLDSVEAFYATQEVMSGSGVLPHGMEGLQSYIVSEDTLVSAIVSTTIRAVEGLWRREAEKLMAPVRKGSIGESFGGGSRRPPDPPKFSTVFDLLGSLMHDMSVSNSRKAEYVRNKAFTSAVLFLSGDFQPLRLRIESSNDESIALSVLKDLEVCPKKIRALQNQLGEPVVSSESAEVFLSAAGKLMSDVASLLLQRFFETDEQLPKLFSLLFVTQAWQTGEVTSTLIAKLRLFHETKLDGLPETVHDHFEAQLLHGFIVRYIRQFLLGIRPARMTFDDITRFVHDETTVKEWIEFGPWTIRSARLDQLCILRWTRIFLLVPASEVLANFGEILTDLDQTLCLPLYDLVRYCCKLRPDIHPNVYKPVLASCAEYMSQHQSSGVTPAPMNAAKDILVELFPQAGVYHITGKPWKLEERDDKGKMLEVASLVIENTNRAARRASSSAQSTPPKPRLDMNTASPPIGAAVEVNGLHESLDVLRRQSDADEGRVDEVHHGHRPEPAAEPLGADHVSWRVLDHASPPSPDVDDLEDGSNVHRVYGSADGTAPLADTPIVNATHGFVDRHESLSAANTSHHCDPLPSEGNDDRSHSAMGAEGWVGGSHDGGAVQGHSSAKTPSGMRQSPSRKESSAEEDGTTQVASNGGRLTFSLPGRRSSSQGHESSHRATGGDGGSGAIPQANAVVLPTPAPAATQPPDVRADGHGRLLPQSTAGRPGYRTAASAPVEANPFADDEDEEIPVAPSTGRRVFGQVTRSPPRRAETLGPEAEGRRAFAGGLWAADVSPVKARGLPLVPRPPPEEGPPPRSFGGSAPPQRQAPSRGQGAPQRSGEPRRFGEAIR